MKDSYGEKTLKVIGAADDFNRWMFETIKPFCDGDILEIGSGIGNISKFFFESNIPIHCSDYNLNYCEQLKASFSSQPLCRSILNIDLVHPNFDTIYKNKLGNFQTVFALNVIEHIKDDDLAISNCKKLLKPDGHLIILVPAFQSLYNHFDKSLGHHRRYKTSTAKMLFQQSEFTVFHQQYFNAFGLLGWFWSGAVRKRKYIPLWQMKFFNLVLPLTKFLDVLLFKKVGLSVITVGKK